MKITNLEIGISDYKLEYLSLRHFAYFSSLFFYISSLTIPENSLFECSKVQKVRHWIQIRTNYDVSFYLLWQQFIHHCNYESSKSITCHYFPQIYLDSNQNRNQFFWIIRIVEAKKRKRFDITCNNLSTRLEIS